MRGSWVAAAMLGITLVWCVVLTHKYAALRSRCGQSPTRGTPGVSQTQDLQLDLLGVTVPPVEVYRVDRQRTTLPLRRSKWTLLILFHPDDWGACMSEYRLWNKLENTFPDSALSVIAVGLAAVPDVVAWLTSTPAEFPVYCDPEDRLRRTLGLLDTSPVRLLVDRFGRIVHVGTPAGDLESWRLLERAIRRLVDWSR